MPETRTKRVAETVRRVRAGEARAVTSVLHGALAASITPLRDHGTTVDDEAFGPLVDFFVGAGLDGILALGTAGEGILLDSTSVATSPISSCRPRTDGSRSPCTAARRPPRTPSRSRRTRPRSAPDAVVVIGPPYFKLDEKAQYAHFLAAALACAPLPFYVYEFAATTGYAVAPAVLERLRDDARERRRPEGLGHALGAVRRVPLPGFDIFVGPEALIADGMAHGAVGAVSALASALPREVAAVVRDPTPEGAARLGELRAVRRALSASGRAQAPARASGRSREGGRPGAAARAHGRRA